LEVDVELKVDGDPLPNTLAACKEELLQLCNEVPGYKERLLELSKKQVAHARLMQLELQIGEMEGVLVKAERIAAMAQQKVDLEMSEDPEKKKKDLARLRLVLARKLKGKDYHACEKLHREIESIDCCIKGKDLAPHMRVHIKYLGDDGWHFIDAVLRHDMLDGSFAVAYDENARFCKLCVAKAKAGQGGASSGVVGACVRDFKKLPMTVPIGNIVSEEDQQLLTAKRVLAKLNALVQNIEYSLEGVVRAASNDRWVEDDPGGLGAVAKPHFLLASRLKGVKTRAELCRCSALYSVLCSALYSVLC
jgi:hypothetical protein